MTYQRTGIHEQDERIGILKSAIPPEWWAMDAHTREVEIRAHLLIMAQDARPDWTPEQHMAYACKPIDVIFDDGSQLH